MALLSIIGLRKSYSRGKPAVVDMNLEIESGELISLLGPSGCGKTTTLRCIAGLERPDAGRIVVDGRPVFEGEGSSQTFVPPERRGMAMVFQNYALWPHMDVYQNVAFGLRGKRLSRSEVASSVERALRSVRLWEFRERRIGSLSGGQQQRVALARAIAPSPALVLLDEPLSNLDMRLREAMRLEVLELLPKMGLTSIYVTHDQDEAFSLSSRIVVMNNGVVEQIAGPDDVWNHPATPFVADFVGSTNRLVGTVVAAPIGTGRALDVDGGYPIALPPDTVWRPGDRVEAYLKTRATRLSEAGGGDATNEWRVPVELESFHGDYVLTAIRFGENRLLSRGGKRFGSDAAQQVYLRIDPEDLVIFPLRGL